jgi:outer membrane protein TolC
MEAAGEPFGSPHAQRALPALGADAGLREVLRYAFLSNAGIERAFFEWRAALERVPQAVSLDDPRLSYEYLFSDEKFDRWDRTTVGVAQMFPFPGKLTLAGEAAFQEAVAAGRRFEDAKFGLQSEVVAAWSELWLADQRISIEAANLELLREFAEITRGRLEVGRAAQAETAKADLEVASAQNELLRLQAARPPALARLNALLSRPPETPLGPRSSEARSLARGDAEILALAAERNPELRALAAEVAAREVAIELAWRQYLPDLKVGLDVRGSMERMLMGVINVPLRYARIQAAIREARGAERAAEAGVRARRDDLRAQVVLQLFLARDGTRQASLLDQVLIPRADEVVGATAAGYATGGMAFLDLLDAQRSLLLLRLARAEVDAQRASAVAALEALCAVDLGTLS